MSLSMQLFAQYPIVGIKNQKVADQRWMNTTANLSANGALEVEVYSKTNKNWYRLRGFVKISCYDVAGNLIYYSNDFQITTRCGLMDPVCDSDGTDKFVQSLPPAIGRDTRRIEIYHTTKSFHDIVTTLNNSLRIVKEGGKVASDTAEEIGKLIF